MREKSLELLKSYIKQPAMFKHSLASEVVLRALAKRLQEDEEKWALAGLLHDIDVEMTSGDLQVHGLEAEKILKSHGYEEDLIEAVKLHNTLSSGIPRTKPFHWAVACGETITGLIMATTYVYPDKKLQSVKASSIVKRMKEKAFAASVNRDIIRECEHLNIPLAEFAELALNAMKEISDELEL